MRNLKDKKFGRLLVMNVTKLRQGTNVVWLCKCDCGKLTNVHSGHLVTGHTQSCGCLNREISTKHGGRNTRLYTIHQDMLQRCYNINQSNYKYYGKKGIQICPSWKSSFVTFRDWALAHGYQGHLTIDRINDSENYEPSNCRWITRSENTRRRKYNQEKLQ